MMSRLVWLIVLFFPLTLPGTGRSGVYEGNPGLLTIRVQPHVLTLQATEVSHRHLLTQLAKYLQFELFIVGALEGRRSLEIDSRPWEEALKKALYPASWAFVYDTSKAKPRLAKVFVFPAKTDNIGTGSPFLSPSYIALPVTTPPPSAPQDSKASYLAMHDLDASLAELLEAEDGEMRALALVALATMEGEKPIAALTQVLDDEEPWIRETAVEALAEIGGEQAIQGLRRALDDESEDVRRAAQEALIRLQTDPQ